MRYTKVTFSEPQAAFVADAVLLLVAMLEKDTQAVGTIFSLIGNSLADKNYSNETIQEVVSVVHTIASSWAPPGGMLS